MEARLRLAVDAVITATISHPHRFALSEFFAATITAQHGPYFFLHLLSFLLFGKLG